MEAQSSSYMVGGYAAYLAVSVAMTIWVARTLHKNGAVFLIETFLGKEKLAESVNHLLVVGFYLVNIGFVALALRSSEPVWHVQAAVEVMSAKIGRVLLVLGGMHFFNLYVFTRIQRAAAQRNAPPPVTPRQFVPVAAPVVTRVGA